MEVFRVKWKMRKYVIILLCIEDVLLALEFLRSNFAFRLDIAFYKPLAALDQSILSERWV